MGRVMSRYLARIVNSTGYKPSDARNLAQKIRGILGSREAIGNLRVSSQAIEFDLFANDSQELESRRSILEKEIGEVATLKPLDQASTQTYEKLDVLREGVQLFNEERFWEAHEVLERVWHPAKGVERDIIQGMILTAAALVHAQKDRNDTALNMLRKAREKLGTEGDYQGIDLNQVRQRIGDMLQARSPEPFKIKL